MDEKLKLLVLQGSPRPRFLRLAAYVASMFVVSVGLSYFLGLPYCPHRSEFAFMAYQIVTLADVLLAFILVAFVADAIQVFWHFSTCLSRNATQWPRETKQKYADELGMAASDPLLDYWIDLDFIAKRTSCLGSLIYYPFVVLALLIISRSPIFANFAFSASIAITLGIGFLILLASAFALRSAAEEARSEARKAITKGIMSEKRCSPRLAAPVHAARAAQLEALLARIDSLNEGAFLPLMQQPPVRAVLLPLGSVGLTLLTELGLIPGL